MRKQILITISGTPKSGKSMLIHLITKLFGSFANSVTVKGANACDNWNAAKDTDVIISEVEVAGEERATPTIRLNTNQTITLLEVRRGTHQHQSHMGTYADDLQLLRQMELIYIPNDSLSYHLTEDGEVLCEWILNAASI